MATTNQVQSLYIAYFGRPADPLGLEFWKGDGESESYEALKGLAAAMYATPEFQAVIAGKTNTEVITSFYQNSFNRDPEPGGLDAWLSVVPQFTSIQEVGLFIAEAALTTGTQRLAEGIALDSDQESLLAKTIAADQYTLLVRTTGSSNYYVGDAAIAAGILFLDPVTNRSNVPGPSQVRDAVISLPGAGGGNGGGAQQPLVNNLALSVFTDLAGSVVRAQQWNVNGIIPTNPTLGQLVATLPFVFNANNQTVNGTEADIQGTSTVNGQGVPQANRDILNDASTADSDTLNITGVTQAVERALVQNIENVNLALVASATGDIIDDDGQDGLEVENATTIALTGTVAQNATITLDARGSGASTIGLALTEAAGNAISVVTADNVATTVNGGGLRDNITGGTQADTLNGGADNDTFNFSSAALLRADTVNGGADTDTINITANSLTIVDADFANKSNLEVITLANGSQSLTLGTNAAAATSTLVVNGGDNVDLITATLLGEAVTINGGGSNDTLTSGTAQDILNGDGGNDTLNGAGNADQLNGGANNDVLNGGAGGDSLTGGANDDAFFYSAASEGGDTIVDFETGTNTIRLTADQNTAAADIFDAGHIVLAGTDPTNVLGALVTVVATDYNDDVVANKVWEDNHICVLTTASGYTDVDAALGAMDTGGSTVGDGDSGILIYFNTTNTVTEMAYVESTGTKAGGYDSTSTLLASFTDVAAADIDTAFDNTSFVVQSLS